MKTKQWTFWAGTRKVVVKQGDLKRGQDTWFFARERARVLLGTDAVRTEDADVSR